MSLRVLTWGLGNEIRDQGRKGVAHMGVKPGGASDLLSLQTGNVLLQNSAYEAAIEIIDPKAQFQFIDNKCFLISGADFGALLDNTPIQNYVIYEAKAGQKLIFTKPMNGQMAYLQVAGGFDLPFVHHSKSNQEPWVSYQISDECVLKCNPGKEVIKGLQSTYWQRRDVIRFLPGPEFHDFDFQTIAATKLSSSNRQGAFLEHKPLPRKNTKEMVSAVVSEGTVQVLPNNKMVVLMADHQTMGGYPRLGTIIPTDLSKLAQIPWNNRFALEETDLATAENELLKFQDYLTKLKASVQFLNK